MVVCSSYRNFMDEMHSILCEINKLKPEPEICNATCPPLGCPRGPCPGLCCDGATCDPCCMSGMPPCPPPPLRCRLTVNCGPPRAEIIPPSLRRCVLKKKFCPLPIVNCPVSTSLPFCPSPCGPPPLCAAPPCSISPCCPSFQGCPPCNVPSCLRDCSGPCSVSPCLPPPVCNPAPGSCYLCIPNK